MSHQNNSVRKRGYRDVYFNIKSGKFYEPIAGDNFKELSVSTSEDLTIGDGKISIVDSDGNAVGDFTVNQAGDKTITLPQVVIPEALSPKGFINVAEQAPVNPSTGDIYMQHTDAGTAVTADASFAPGITGQVEEGEFVVFTVNGTWANGGQSTSTQEQSDWNESDITSAAYIANKPTIPDAYTKAESDAKYINVNIQNLTHIEDFGEDDDYFALKSTMATNFARVEQ